MKLVLEKGRYQLESPLNATLDEYLHMLEILTEKLDLHDIDFVNGYDSYFHTFNFNNVEVLASYNNFLGIWILVSSEVNTEVQKDTLEKINLVLET